MHPIVRPSSSLYANTTQYNLPPNSVVFTGCVGEDDLAKELRVANDKEGLKDVYLVKKTEETGACAVVITGHNRLVLWYKKEDIIFILV